ncbi:MAG: hypothetical protein WBF93_16940 [Pirellulales bacterium]
MVARGTGSLPFLLVLCVSFVFAEDDQQALQVGDLSKTLVIERPTRLLVNNSSELPPNPKAANPLPDRNGDAAEDIVADESKQDLEVPVKDAIADTRKWAVEMPVKEMIGKPNPAAAFVTNLPLPTNTTPPTNPKVAPGKVSWHPDFAAACEASRKSGKPVLHFQLLGNLDDQFC